MVTNFEGRAAHLFRCTSLQASFLYILYSGIIQYYYNYYYAVGVSIHAVAGSLMWIRMRHATCTQ